MNCYIYTTPNKHGIRDINYRATAKKYLLEYIHSEGIGPGIEDKLTKLVDSALKTALRTQAREFVSQMPEGFNTAAIREDVYQQIRHQLDGAITIDGEGQHKLEEATA